MTRPLKASLLPMSLTTVRFILIFLLSRFFLGSSGIFYVTQNWDVLTGFLGDILDDGGKAATSTESLDNDPLLAIDELFHLLSKRDARLQRNLRKKGKPMSMRKKKLKRKNKNIRKMGKKKGGKRKRAKKKLKTGKEENENQNDDKAKAEARQEAVCNECLPTLALYAKMYEGKAGAIFRQFKRINNFEKLRKTKRDKKGDFSSSFNSIFQTLGSDISNPTCDGEPTAGNAALQPFSGI